MYEYMEPIEDVLTIPGKRISEIFLDEYGAVRDRVTGGTRWTYPESDWYHVVGLSGDVFVLIQDGSRMRGYNAQDGSTLWTVSMDQFFKGNESMRDAGPVSFVPDRDRHRVTGDGETLVVLAGSTLTAIDSHTGATVWTRGAGGSIVKEHQNYLILSDDGRLRAFRFNE